MSTSDNSDNNPNASHDGAAKEGLAIEKAKDAAGKAMQSADNVGKIMEGAGNAFNAIKWVAIAVVFGLATFLGIGIYKAVVAPVKAVGNAAGAVTDTVKSGASSVKEGTSDMINRLDIETKNQMKLNRLSESAFTAVSNMAALKPETMKQRLYWKTNFNGHENKVCALSMKFGGEPIPVFIAADNKGYATSKSLGSKKDRAIRIILRAPGDDVPLNVVWDNETGAWAMKWKGTTLKKSLDDSDAEKRVLDVLASASAKCK